MGKLGKALAIHTTIGLDTAIFIYHLEGNPNYLPLTRQLLEDVQAGEWQALTSTITLLELTVPAWRAGRDYVAREYETILVNFPHLRLQDVTREVARWGAQLRARFNIRTPDALQIAASLEGGATAFVTNDRNLLRLSEVVSVIVLDDYR
jgi:predicted nucleic acid-binding protein